MENNYCVFIISHGRPNNVITYKTLERCGYVGKTYIIIDNEDKTINEYKSIYGDLVIVFDKKYYADLADEGNNFDNRKTTTHARNACFDIAENLGYKYFMVLDDDYTMFMYRLKNKMGNQGMIKNLSKIIEYFIEFLIKTNSISVAFSQGGDHIGGFTETLLKRKCMNSFICRTDRKYMFLGQLNEDVNTYVVLGSRGELFFTYTSIQLNQKQTQSQSGGMTDAYQLYGTYIKSFTTVMMHPSSVYVTFLNTTNKRLHHNIKWPLTVPQIIKEKYKKI